MQKISDATELFGEFMTAWRDLEMALNEKFPNLDSHRPVSIMELMRTLSESGMVSKQELKDLEELRRVRNAMAHARPSPIPLTPDVILRIQAYAQRISKHNGP